MMPKHSQALQFRKLQHQKIWLFGLSNESNKSDAFDANESLAFGPGEPAFTPGRVSAPLLLCLLWLRDEHHCVQSHRLSSWCQSESSGKDFETWKKFSLRLFIIARAFYFPPKKYLNSVVCLSNQHSGIYSFNDTIQTFRNGSCQWGGFFGVVVVVVLPPPQNSFSSFPQSHSENWSRRNAAAILTPPLYSEQWQARPIAAVSP